MQQQKPQRHQLSLPQPLNAKKFASDLYGSLLFTLYTGRNIILFISSPKNIIKILSFLKEKQTHLSGTYIFLLKSFF